jgi:hypothetical protein
VGVFLFILFLLVIAAIVVVPIIVMYSRRQARDQKNYERGLKMVPLYIHLPPISEDTDANGRDVRDLVDENISKAQIIYNIIASTYEKGFKRRLYGQQHFAFEVISSQGFVYLYTTVPIGLVDVVRQAIVSAYPAARLEEAEEHNIFNNSGKASGTTGGELVLKESFAYPIATYMDLKRDAMQAMLNSLSTVGKEDGAAIQILLRPADPSWRRTAHGIAESKRKGEDDNGGAKKAVGILKDIGSALNKPPEGSEKGGSDKKELSEHEQAVLNSIDDKTRYPAYEVLIRLVASSNVAQQSQTILNNMVAAFSLFDAPGKNGFKYEPAKDIDELVTSYIMKFFPQDRNKTILNSVELATIFHFPDQRSIPTTQLERQDSKQVDGPRNMPDDGLLLGYNVFRGVKKAIRLAIQDRQRHMYVVGQTGTGKSTFLENLALQDMLSGNGFAFVDPHGDTAEKLLSMVPKERTEDVIYFCPADMEYPMGLNLFEFQNPDQKDFLIQEALNMLKKLYDPNNQGIMGPRYEHLFRNAALTVMADPAGGTFIDIPKLFRDPQYVKQKLEYVKDLNVLEFWQKEMPQSQRSNEFGEVVSWFVSKFGAFLSNEMMRNIIGQTKSSFDLRDIMDNKKILLVNLSKGRTGDLNSKLLGMVFVMKFQAAAMSRANILEKDRVDFSLYVDEFQNFSTDSFATIMSEARKYHLNLIVANQFTTQLTEEIRDAVFGNMGTIVAFRIGQNDVDSLSRYFQPVFDGDDLLRVPNYNTIVRTLVGGVPTQPFSMTTLAPLGDPNGKLSDALKQLSAAKYGRPKAAVEKEIFERITTKEAPAPTGPAPGQRPFGASPWQQPGAAAGGFGGAPMPANRGFGAPASPYATANPMGQPGPAPFGGRPPAQASAPAAPKQPASFLDDWLAKRGPTTGAAPSATVPPSSGAGGMPPAVSAVSDSTSTAPVPAPNPLAAEKPQKQDAPSIIKPHGYTAKSSADDAGSRSDVHNQSHDRNHEESHDTDSETSHHKKRRHSKSADSVESADNSDKAEPGNNPPASDPGLMQLKHDAKDLERLEAARRKHEEDERARVREDERKRQQEREQAKKREQERLRREQEVEQRIRERSMQPKPTPEPTPEPAPSAPADVVQPEPKHQHPQDQRTHDEPGKSDAANQQQKIAPHVIQTSSNQPGPTIVSPHSEDELPSLETLKANQLRNRDELTHGDTIYIDQDGNLKLVADKVKSDKPAAS